MRDLCAKDSGRYNVRGLCVLFGKSKQAYYQYDENLALGKAAREEFAPEYIRGIRARDPGIGGVKLWHMYRKEFSCDGPIGRDRFCRIIDENRLKVRQRRLCGDAPPRGICISMTESGDPKENAQAERINNTMKNELLKGKVFHSLEEVIAATALAADSYNNRRPHMSIGMMTPAEASETSGDRDMRWKSYRMMAIKSRNSLDIAENPLHLPQRHGSPSDLRSSVNP